MLFFTGSIHASRVLDYVLDKNINSKANLLKIYAKIEKKQPYTLAWHFSNITLTLTPILLYSRDRSVRYHWIMKRILPFYGNSYNYSVCRHMRLLSCLERPSITEEPHKTEIDLISEGRLKIENTL